jgi:carboxyl-terminal processing protease
MGSKKLQIALPTLFSLVMALGMYLGYQLREHSGNRSFLNFGKRNNVQEIIDLVKSRYVDDVKMDSISELAINEILSHLDPHSAYIPSSELKDVNEELMGNFQGIGVEFQIFDDTVNVINVIKDGPAEKAGIAIGDKFLKVNDSVSLIGSENNAADIKKKLRGVEGSKESIELLRDNVRKKIIVTRGTIPISTIDAAYIIAPSTGFIRINKFGDRTYEEFMQNLEMLQKKGMDKLILDLRGNGGGLMSEAIDIADEFLDDNKLIVYTQGTNSPRIDFKCKRDGLFEKGKLVVLVDETSASASEVLTGALQDWDRATIVGRRTFGKGLVQQQFQLSDGSAVRLTVSRYYSPLGRNIQKPYSNKTTQEYQDELLDRYNNGELENGSTIKDNSKSYKTPAGKIVYGGGGIIPDYFVKLDTTSLIKEFKEMYAKNTLNKTAYLYFLENKNYLKQFKTTGELLQKLNHNEAIWKKLLYVTSKDSISISNNEILKTEVINKIKYNISRYIFNNEGYYEAVNSTDSIVQKSLNIIRK